MRKKRITNRQKYIEECFLPLIPHGSVAPIPMKSLSVILDTTDRNIRKLAEESRDLGYLVASKQMGDNRGYFIAVKPEEMREYIDTTENRVATAMRGLIPFEKALRGMR